MTRSIWTWVGFLVVAVALAAPGRAAAAEHRFGGGIHYWRTLEDLADERFDIKEDGTAYVLSYQLLPAGIFRFEADVEYFPEEFGGADQEVWSPQVYVLVGHGLYAGVGIGVLYSSDFNDTFSDPFYAARAGFEMTLVPRLHLDVNANYRANAFGDLGNVDVDTLTLGAQVRIGFGQRNP